MVSKKSKNVMFWIGLVIVFGTHIYMLLAGLPSSQIVPHSITNIVAGGLIVAGR